MLELVELALYQKRREIGRRFSKRRAEKEETMRIAKLLEFSCDEIFQSELPHTLKEVRAVDKFLRLQETLNARGRLLQHELMGIELQNRSVAERLAKISKLICQERTIKKLSTELLSEIEFLELKIIYE